MPTKDPQTTPTATATPKATSRGPEAPDVVGLSTAFVESLSDIGSEVLSFVAERIQEDVKTQHRLLHCKDLSEMQHIQAEFVQKAIDQYTAETGKLVQLSQDLFKLGVTGGARETNGGGSR